MEETEMSDLDGVLSVIAAYPVHILTFAGCILLLVLVLPKRKRQHKYLSISPASSAKKAELSKDEKQQLAEKINENRMRNIQKSAAIDENANFMIFATIILILLSLAFIVGAIIPDYRKYLFALIPLYIVGVILLKLYKYLVKIWSRKGNYQSNKT